MIVPEVVALGRLSVLDDDMRVGMKARKPVADEGDDAMRPTVPENECVVEVYGKKNHGVNPTP